MEVISQPNLEKLNALNNKNVLGIVKEFINVCKPSKVTVITDSKEDIDYVRRRAIEVKEEENLTLEGHTIHFDGFFTMSYHDQARDKEHTQILVPKEELDSYPWINTMEREKGLKEVLEIMDGCMEGHE